MNQYAETVRISPDDYYDFIDPQRKLTAPQRVAKAEELLDDMPGSFPKALAFVMKQEHVTIEKLAEEAHISTSTVDRYKRPGKESFYNPDKVVAMCVAMHLPPWLSCELLNAAGISLFGSRRNRELAWVIQTLFKCTVDEVQKNLIAYGGKPLKLSI